MPGRRKLGVQQSKELQPKLWKYQMMTIDALTELLGWASTINIVVLMLSTLGLVAMRGVISNIHSRLFGLDEKDLGRAYFQYLAQYKIAIIVLNIAPYLALKIMA